MKGAGRAGAGAGPAGGASGAVRAPARRGMPCPTDPARDRGRGRLPSTPTSVLSALGIAMKRHVILSRPPPGHPQPPEQTPVSARRWLTPSTSGASRAVPLSSSGGKLKTFRDGVHPRRLVGRLTTPLPARREAPARWARARWLPPTCGWSGLPVTASVHAAQGPHHLSRRQSSHPQLRSASSCRSRR